MWVEEERGVKRPRRITPSLSSAIRAASTTGTSTPREAASSRAVVGPTISSRPRSSSRTAPSSGNARASGTRSAATQSPDPLGPTVPDQLVEPGLPGTFRSARSDLPPRSGSPTPATHRAARRRGSLRARPRPAPVRSHRHPARRDHQRSRARRRAASAPPGCGAPPAAHRPGRRRVARSGSHGRAATARVGRARRSGSPALDLSSISSSPVRSIASCRQSSMVCSTSGWLGNLPIARNVLQARCCIGKRRREQILRLHPLKLAAPPSSRSDIAAPRARCSRSSASGSRTPAHREKPGSGFLARSSGSGTGRPNRAGRNAAVRGRAAPRLRSPRPGARS